jgi:hypothetical protein
MKQRLSKDIFSMPLTVLSILLLTSCASMNSSPRDMEASMAKPLSPGQARVCFVRLFSLVGMSASHQVFDCGTNIGFDSKVIEKEQIKLGKPSTGFIDGIAKPVEATFHDVTVTQVLPEKEVNKGYMWNVQHVVLPEDPAVPRPTVTELVPENAFVQVRETYSPRWMLEPLISGKAVFVNGSRVGVKSSPRNTWGVVQVPGGVGILTFRDKSVTSDATDRIKPNARYMGSVGAGGALSFDRPAGTLRLRTVTPGGDEAFAPDFQISAGKKYVVEYSYNSSGVNFSIKEH